jgi:Zn-dependent protease with chaperone function
LLAVLAAAALAVLLRAPLVALQTWRATRRLESCWLAAAQRLTVPGLGFPVWTVRDGRVGIWLSGLLRPRLIAGASLLDALTDDERAAALEHEHAHARSRDNLWRLVLFAWPGTLSVTRLGRRLEQEWSAASEAAADERAAGGDAVAALELASALVKVARLAPPMPALGASALSSGDVSLRVQSLLDTGARRSSRALAAACAAVALPLLAIVSLSLHTGFLAAVHAAAELLVRRF